MRIFCGRHVHVAPVLCRLLITAPLWARPHDARIVRSLARSLVPLLKIRRNPSTTRASSERCQNEGEEEEDGDPTDDLNVSIMRGFVHDNESGAVRLTRMSPPSPPPQMRSHRSMRSPLAIRCPCPVFRKKADAAPAE